MTEEKFTELVNLYLDKEISSDGLARLKAELAENAARKADFQERCRLHQAMRLALNPNEAKTRAGRSGSSRAHASASRRSPPGSRPASRPASSARRSTRLDPRLEGRGQAALPPWILGTGLAACCAVALVLLPPVFRDTPGVISQSGLIAGDAEERREVDPLDSIGRAELLRFASIQERRAESQGSSLAGRLRLMGLRPELAPEQKQVRFVNLAAKRTVASPDDNVFFLVEGQKPTPMPEPRILRMEPQFADPVTRWPGSFHSSLASFK